MDITTAFQNLDLLAVGATIAAIGILGFVVFFNDRKSTTNRAFLAFALVTVFYGVVNYLSYRVTSPDLILWLLRLTIFSATWHAFSFFHLFYVFPKTRKPLPKPYKYGLIPIVTITSLITLTPLAFSRLSEVAKIGQVTNPERGPGMPLFGAVVIFLVIGGLYILIRKTISASKEEKHQFQLVTAGTIITFICLIAFNFVLPVIFNNLVLIPLAPLFIFPFIAFTSYAMIRGHLLGIKVITTEILMFVLAMTTLTEIILSQNTSQTVFRSGVFILVLSFGILLIRSVRREVEQRERLEVVTKELSSANDKLKELDQQKSQFLSFASHDLKSPINIIKQFATLIADGTYKEPAKVQETITKIKTTADRAITLVDDFLDIRKIEEGKMDYSFETKDIVSFVKGITEDFAPMAKAQKNIDITFTTTTPSLMVKIDTTRMRQVIQNYLSNSLKYTESSPPDGRVNWIKVMVTEEQNSVLISVKDSGIGMSAELLPTLFEQFRRDKNVAKKIQGTGLGLYISKQIVLVHGGETWAQSEGPGKGSTFFVRLKKA